MTARWTRLRSDGTNYRCWQSTDGLVVETKPRFRPAMPYTLYFPAVLRVEGLRNCITFPSLVDARAASKWPIERLRELAAEQKANWDRILANTAANTRERAVRPAQESRG